MTRNRTSILPCCKAIKHIQADLDSNFYKKNYRLIKKHIEQCPNCLCYLDSLKKVIYLYKCLPDLHPGIKSRKKLHMIINLAMEHKQYK